MCQFSALALASQVPDQVVSTGGALALLAGLVVLGLLTLVFWRQVLILLVATMLAVLAYGVVDVLGTMRQ